MDATSTHTHNPTPDPSQAPPSSQLDTIETSLHTSLVNNPYRRERYAKDPREFDASYNVLSHMLQYSHPETIARLRDCGNNAAFYYDKEAQRVRVSATHCNLRWCPICATRRTKFVAGLVYDWLSAAREPAFITLTLAHRPGETIADQLIRLRKAFPRFRRDKNIKFNLHGGVWFLQVKRGTDGQWHSHLHIAADFTFVDKRIISRIWLQSTGDSRIIDVSRIHDKKRLAAYVARYIAKPARLSDFSFSDGVELVASLKGRRMYGRFGNAPKSMLSDPPEEPTDNRIRLSSFKALLAAAELGIYPECSAVLHAYRTASQIDLDTITRAVETLSYFESPSPDSS